MPQSPIISSIITIPTSEPSSADSSHTAGAAVSIGLVLDGRHIYWGTCPGPRPVDPAQQENDSWRASIVDTIQQQLGPLLVGRSLETLRPLVAELDDIRETVTETRTVNPSPEQLIGGKLSRRALLTGRLAPPAPRTEQITVQRALLPAVRFGMSHAILAALADISGVMATELIADEYDLGSHAFQPIIQVELNEQLVQGTVPAHINAFGYTTSGDDPIRELGEAAELLQRRVRKIKELLAATRSPPQTIINLNLRGGLGQLYDNNVGQLLGALYGLEQAARPYLIRVQDPFQADDLGAKIKLMAQLKWYLGTRRMKTQLIGGSGLHRMADLVDFLSEDAAHLIKLNPPQFGSIVQTVEAILACQEKGIGVLLDNREDDAGLSAAICHIAVATGALQMDVGTASRAAAVTQEILRIAAWLDFKRASVV